MKSLNRAIQGHDSALFVQETKPGRVDVYRRSKFGGAPPNYIFSLTDNWNASGTPVPWGIEVILNRLKAMDLWRDDTFVERWIQEQGAAEESKDRGFRNSVESFLYDLRPQFHKAFNGVNTSLLEKKKPKEGLKYGTR